MEGDERQEVPSGRTDEEFEPLPLSRMHFVILAICAAILCVDGYDIYLVGSLGPAIAADFRVPAEALTIVFLAQQVCLAAGSAIVGPISDRQGRVPTLAGCTVAAGALTVAAGFAPSLGWFAAIRGVSALFLGGAVPVAVALLMELTPRRHSGLFVALAFAGLTAGSMSGALVAAFLLDDHGWRIGLWIGGALPLVLAPIILLVLPESISFLRRCNPRDPRIARIMCRLGGSLPEAMRASPTPPDARPERPGRPGDLLRGGLARPTIMLWLIFFIGLCCAVLTLSWSPTFFQERGGIPVARYSRMAVIGMLGGIVGTIAIGPLLDRFRASVVLGAYYLLSAACLFGVGHIAFGAPGFALALCGATFFQAGAQSGLSVLASRIYPARVRATGVGFALGAGRLGSIGGAAGGGLMLAGGWSLPQFFLTIAGALAFAAVLTWLLGRLQIGSDRSAVRSAVPNHSTIHTSKKGFQR